MKKLWRMILWLSCMPGIAGLLFAQEAQPAASSKKAAPEISVPVPAKGAPLKNLAKQKDGHFSPYLAPELPAGAQTHVIAQGETLWGIAGQKLNNSYLWPQIWEKNPYITNPHWIYPGDLLLLETPKLVDEPVAVPPQEVAAEEKTEEVPLNALQRRLPQSGKAYRPLSLAVKDLDTYYASDRELYGKGRITTGPLSFNVFIVGSEQEQFKRTLGEGDIVYLNKGTRENVFPGSRFQILRSGGEISNPLTGKFIGYFYHELGLLKVILAHDDNAIAQVEMSSNPVYVGDALLPFVEKQKIPRDKSHQAVRFTEDNGKPSANIVYIEDHRDWAADGDVVFVDMGKNSGIQPGQICTVYRVEGEFKKENEFYSEFATANSRETIEKGFRKQSRAAIDQRSIPRIILGELVVVDVYENSAKALVITSHQFIRIGSFSQVQ